MIIIDVISDCLLKYMPVEPRNKPLLYILVFMYNWRTIKPLFCIVVFMRRYKPLLCTGIRVKTHSVPGEGIHLYSVPG